MRLTRWVAVVAVACGGFSAEAVAQTEEEGSTALEDVSLKAPDPKAGWRLVEFKNGYARWEEDTPSDGQAKGSVQVVPAPKADAATDERSEATASSQEAAPARESSDHVCEDQKRALAVRLLYLRGIEATLDNAPLLLAAAEAPLGPQAWANIQAFGPGVGSSLLTTAYATDLVARGLVDSLARCLTDAER